MTELPTTPFPELRPLDAKRKVPSLADLLRNAPSLPAPDLALPEPSGTGALRIPVLPFPGPDRSAPADFEPSSSSGDLPASGHLPEALASLMEDESGESTNPESEDFALPPLEDIVTSPGRGGDPGVTATDEELVEALQPIFESTMERALYAPETGLHAYLEPMLRSTVRRAIAEQLAASSQFRAISTLDRLAWRLRALVTSRSYDEIVFHRTRRYQVEEAYLVRKKDRGMVSYASHDPARHASPRRVQSTLRMLTSRLQDNDGQLQSSIDLPERRVALVREGAYTLLIAIIRGRSNALVRADLDYIQRQAEERFGSRLEARSNAFVHVLQPILEGCLLIQSPAPPP